MYRNFEDYSTTMKSILPVKSQKEFEKTKTSITIKFIRYILTNRMNAFEAHRAGKTQNNKNANESNGRHSSVTDQWNSTLEEQMKAHFDEKDSVFLKHFDKVVSEKFDLEEFKKYWFITIGNQTNLIIKFYDNALKYFDRTSKVFASRDSKIKATKQKVGISLPREEEMKELSITNYNFDVSCIIPDNSKMIKPIHKSCLSTTMTGFSSGFTCSNFKKLENPTMTSTLFKNNQNIFQLQPEDSCRKLPKSFKSLKHREAMKKVA